MNSDAVQIQMKPLLVVYFDVMQVERYTQLVSPMSTVSHLEFLSVVNLCTMNDNQLDLE